MLNVNVPACTVARACEGIEVTRLGKRVYQDELVQRLDPRGIPYYWIGGPPPSGLAIEGTDFHAVVNRRIAVTPIHLDLTGVELLQRLGGWDWSPAAQTQPSAPAAEPPGPEARAEAEHDRDLSDELRRERR